MPDREAKQIDLKALKQVVNVVLDHLLEDLQIQSVVIDDSKDLYWELPFEVAHDISEPPHDEFGVGKLSDDCDLIRNVSRGQGGDISYNFVHVWPLLRYIAETVKR